MQNWGVDTTNETRGGLVDQAGWDSPRQVQLLQRKHSKHGKNLGKTTGWIHRAGLKNSGVEMIGGVTYNKVDFDGNLHVTVKTPIKGEKGQFHTEERVLEVDNVVVCAGQVSLLELDAPLKAYGVKTFK